MCHEAYSPLAVLSCCSFVLSHFLSPPFILVTFWHKLMKRERRAHPSLLHSPNVCVFFFFKPSSIYNPSSSEHSVIFAPVACQKRKYSGVHPRVSTLIQPNFQKKTPFTTFFNTQPPYPHLDLTKRTSTFPPHLSPLRFPPLTFSIGKGKGALNP